MGYLGYDVVRRLERLPDTCIDDLRIPELTMLLVGDLAAMDHHTGDVWLIANAVNYDDSPERLEWAYEDAVSRVEALLAALAQPLPPLVTEPVDVPEAEVPPGTHTIRAEIKDKDGRAGFLTFNLKVAKQ